MGLGGDNEPPKKKLKQAQLCFTPKSQKRKLAASDADDDVQFVKIVCKEPSLDASRTVISGKENILSAEKSLFVSECEKKMKVCTESGGSTASVTIDLTDDTPSATNPSDPVKTPSAKNHSDPVKTTSATNPPDPVKTPSATNPPDPVKTTSATNPPDTVKTPSATNPPDPVKTPSAKNPPDTVKTPSATNPPDLGKNNTSDLSLTISDSMIDAFNKSDVSTGSVVESSEQEKKKTMTDDEVMKPMMTEENDDCENAVSGSLNDSVESELNDTLPSDEEEDVACLSSTDETTPNKKTGKDSTAAASLSKLTPRRLASIKKKEERDRQRQEKKAERAKQREEKIKALEEEKKRKKEEKEQKRLAEQRVKEEERKTKEEEKKKREEEKRQKEEERRKKEEAKEEEKRKKEEIEEKKKAAFAKFFQISKQPSVATEKPEENEQNNFMPFPVKPDMKLAPGVRRLLTAEERDSLDCWLREAGENTPGTVPSSYLLELKTGVRTPGSSPPTWPLSSLEEEHDVIIVESETTEPSPEKVDSSVESKKARKLRAKLLQFHDNRRPPYWGTWRKRSSTVKPRRPLGLDKVVFDYEVDSDSEWEDEGEGEDLLEEGETGGGGGGGGDSEGEEEEGEAGSGGENGYLLDNTFVPHGYLSDEEVQPDEELEDNDPENQKMRMTLLKQEFDEEMKSKTERLKPKLLGCVWISNGTTEVSKGSLYERLLEYRAVWEEAAGPLDLTGPPVEESPTQALLPAKKVFPPPVVSTVVKFVHGSTLSFASIIKELLPIIEKEHPSVHVSKRQLTLKVKEIATKTLDYSTWKPTWGVSASLQAAHGLQPLNDTPPQPPAAPQPTVGSAPVQPPLLPVSTCDKPKDSPILNFFNKGFSTPPVKKKVPFITLSNTTSSFDYTPGKLPETGCLKDFGTPRPADPVLVKKRAQLITLSTTPPVRTKGGSLFGSNSTLPTSSPLDNSVPQTETAAKTNEVSKDEKITSTSEVIDLCDISQ